MSIVNLSHITKQFNKVTAVNNLDLQIKEGEFFTFLGPSGCGKTTTLRMIAGFYYPTKGKVLFNDRDVTNLAPEKRNTGMVFQNYALFPHMTVFDNVAFGLKVRKMKKDVIRTKVKEVLSKVHLSKFIDRQVSQLSGGQQQRVALARALVIEPDILLLDEPLSNLDARLRDDMRNEILRLQREYGITTIYVTHDQIEALSMSDRIAVFSEGVCQQVGTPTEIYNKPINDFVAEFIGETNMLDVEVVSELEETMQLKVEGFEEEVTVLQKDNANNFTDEDQLVLSVRPESVQIYNAQTALNNDNVFLGEISKVQFTGEALHTNIKLNDQVVIQMTSLNNNPNHNLKVGNEIKIQLPTDQIRVIPKVGSDSQ